MSKTIAEIVKDVEESARNDERKKIMSAMIENGDVDAWRRAVIRQKIVIDWDGSAQQGVKRTAKKPRKVSNPEYDHVREALGEF